MADPELPLELPASRNPRTGSTETNLQKRVAFPPALYIICVVVMLFMYMLFSRSPLLSLLKIFVSVIPAALTALFIVHLASPELPKEFYIEQIFYRALPGFFLAVLVPAVVLMIVAEKATIIMSNGAAWKEVLWGLFTAFTIAGSRETVKLLIGLRSKKVGDRRSARH